MSYPTCRPWTLPRDYFGATWEGYHTSGFAHSRDSDLVEESNFRVALAELEKLSTEVKGESSVRTVRESHWAVGWVEWIAINNDNVAAIEKAKELCQAREEYPILDEEVYSELEQETANEIWKDCYSIKERLAHIRAHRNQYHFRDFADLMGCVRGEYFGGYAWELI